MTPNVGTTPTEPTLLIRGSAGMLASAIAQLLFLVVGLQLLDGKVGWHHAGVLLLFSVATDLPLVYGGWTLSRIARLPRIARWSLRVGLVSSVALTIALYTVMRPDLWGAQTSLQTMLAFFRTARWHSVFGAAAQTLTLVPVYFLLATAGSRWLRFAMGPAVLLFAFNGVFLVLQVVLIETNPAMRFYDVIDWPLSHVVPVANAVCFLAALVVGVRQAPAEGKPIG